ncbi:hypothetical protein FNV43_RR26784 [Rhamnella rubrinervis]|uniref:PHD-type domain-containing protein n=1 Tax=Rhamnella rubrinervis TaxID=2594499 RepID=A0A8K0DQI6_9ROSA|nr:hypothetical protein FNV43_RR26784 [Rhamnella rubrinervis]
MSNLDASDFKKRKRYSGDCRVFRFKNFGENGHPVEFTNASLRENLKALLEFGHLETKLCCKGMPCWSFQLEVHRHPPLHILLFVVEQHIDDDASQLNRHCKQCHYVGWGHNIICNKKYHFLLLSKDHTMVQACLNCKGNNYKYDSAGNYNNNNNIGKTCSLEVESQGHVMHGVFHSNGFGHLLCVNGVEKGSELAGYQIIEFWDRLCSGLRARKVSLNDFSKKGGMELRLIHGVAYKEPWFGRWGYKLERGTYCVTQEMYHKAIEALQGMPLYLLIHHLGPTNHELPLIFTRYQTLSDHCLVTMGDLFQFMLDLKTRLPKENSPGSSSSYNTGFLVETSTCRWSPKRVETATKVIVEALKRARFRWVSRQEVRDAARAYVGDTGLLDFVLKSLGNHIVGNYLVRRSLNPVTKVLEYCLEDISNVLPIQEGNNLLMMNNNNFKVKAMCRVTRFQVMKDMFYLYKSILKDPKLSTGILNAIPVAVRIILDSKYLVKEYCFGDISMKVDEFGVFCTVMIKNNEDVEHGLVKPPLQPYEYITVRNNATIDELKLEVERNFREIYWGLKSFVVEPITNLNDAKGMDLAFGVVEAGQKLVFEGRINKERAIVNEELYECGARNYAVDCTPCGAKDDDGERMICCDICEIWQHTRCVGIPITEGVPHIFLCSRCEQEIIHLPSFP